MSVSIPSTTIQNRAKYRSDKIKIRNNRVPHNLSTSIQENPNGEMPSRQCKGEKMKHLAKKSNPIKNLLNYE
uniref:Uncharacterized protein n=1 Tax=Arundo donax TaxID=35708 RepID=A0A0A9C9L6_ARUDO